MRLSAIRWIAIAVLSAGCDGAPKTYPVTGKVTLKGGRPLVGALVEFETSVGGKRVTAHGETKEDGTYQLQSPGLGEGAVAGQHKIIVSPPGRDPGNFGGAPPATFDRRFQSYATTPLNFTVKPEGPFVYDFEVTVPRR